MCIPYKGCERSQNAVQITPYDSVPVDESPSETTRISTLRNTVHFPDISPDFPPLKLIVTERPTLTVREVDVVTLVVEGLSNRQIAGELSISSRTVQTHVAASMRKLEAKTRTHLAVLALREGLVPLFPERPLRLIVS
jgi:DNA-binding NarL/FixJ family response regulator